MCRVAEGREERDDLGGVRRAVRQTRHLLHQGAEFPDGQEEPPCRGKEGADPCQGHQCQGEARQGRSCRPRGACEEAAEPDRQMPACAPEGDDGGEDG